MVDCTKGESMSNTCTQSTTIVKIETTLNHVVSLLEKHEEREERMMDAMEKVAGQAEIIHAQAETITRLEKSIEEAFILIRQEKNLTMKILSSEAGIYFLYAIAASLFIDCITHWSLVKTIGKYLFG